LAHNIIFRRNEVKWFGIKYPIKGINWANDLCMFTQNIFRMKKDKLSNIIMLVAGLMVIIFGWFNYAIYQPMSNPVSIRLSQLNWLHKNIGKIPTALLFATIGIFICILALKKLKK
jgi:hypothetical protein